MREQVGTSGGIVITVSTAPSFRDPQLIGYTGIDRLRFHDKIFLFFPF